MSALLVVELTIAANDHKFTILLFQILLGLQQEIWNTAWSWSMAVKKINFMELHPYMNESCWEFPSTKQCRSRIPPLDYRNHVRFQKTKSHQNQHMKHTFMKMHIDSMLHLRASPLCSTLWSSLPSENN